MDYQGMYGIYTFKFLMGVLLYRLAFKSKENADLPLEDVFKALHAGSGCKWILQINWWTAHTQAYKFLCIYSSYTHWQYMSSSSSIRHQQRAHPGIFNHRLLLLPKHSRQQQTNVSVYFEATPLNVSVNLSGL